MSTSRRQFLTRSTLAGAAVAAGAGPTLVSAADAAKPAILGGTPVHKGGWQTWPVWKPEWEAEMLKVCRSGKWNQAAGGNVADFQARWAELLGAKRCLGRVGLLRGNDVTTRFRRLDMRCTRTKTDVAIAISRGSDE